MARTSDVKLADWYHSIPPPVQEIMHTLRKEGYLVYIVGGAVRDLVLGKKPKDFDLVTNATPDQISALFTKTIDIGKQFGISMIVVEAEDDESMTVEVASFRADGVYNDARHPTGVRFASPEEDARRRDFTINGLFWEPESDEVIDYVGGLADVANRVIRTIGNAEARFSEDALRILRGLRFLSQLAPYNFKLEAESLKAIAKLCPSLMRVSRERITQELNLILGSPKPSLALGHLVDLGLWYHWFGAKLPSARVGQVLDQLGSRASESLRWAALMSELETHEDVQKSFTHFILPRAWQDNILTIYCDRASILAAPSMALWELKEFLREETIQDALTLYDLISKNAADGELMDLQKCTVFCQKKLSEFIVKDKLNPPALLTGKDLLTAGIKAGPQIKKILENIRRAQLDESISTKEEALQLVKREFHS